MSNEETVYRVLKEAGDWMTITGVAEKAGLTRNTASKWLWALTRAGRAETKRFASAQIFRAIDK